MVSKLASEPFLRWAGGKRWLAPKIAPFIKERLNGQYYECFLGGGALFFALEPQSAVLSDINEELINAYHYVRTDARKLIKTLKKIPVNKESYYKVRDNIPKSSFSKAARFIYLNRTCYGGLYRTDKEGRFNVPYGGGTRRPDILWERNILVNASSTLIRSNIQLLAADFSEVIKNARTGDVVYCDPTYATTTRENFDRYNGQVFSWNDQIRLANCCFNAFHKGALVIISNVFNKQIKNLYAGAYFIQLQRKKTIGNNANVRKQGYEYIIVLDPEKQFDYWQRI